jgi:hypothetical protein
MISYLKTVFSDLISANPYTSLEEDFFPASSEKPDEILHQTPLTTPKSETSDNQSPSLSQLALNSVWELTDSARGLVSYSKQNPQQATLRLLLRCIQAGIVVALAELRYPELALAVALGGKSHEPSSRPFSYSNKPGSVISSDEDKTPDPKYASFLQVALNSIQNLFSYASQNRPQTILFTLYSCIAAAVALSEQGLIFPAEIDVSALTGENGFNIVGPTGPLTSDVDIKHANNILSNGLSAFLLSYRELGEAYIVPWQREVFSPTLSILNLPNVTKIIGDPYGGGTLYEVGDMDGDGRPELVYAQFARNSVDLIFTPPILPPVIRLSELNKNGIKGTVFTGMPSEGIGYSITSGDITGNGKPALLMGTIKDSVYGFFGINGEWPVSVNLTSDLDGKNGFRLTRKNLGPSTLALVDINIDGILDIAIGATDADWGETDLVDVVFGQKVWPPSMSLDALDGTNGFLIHGFDNGNGGAAIAGAWNIRGDNKWALFIGAPTANVDGSGSVFGIYAQKNWPAVFSVKNMTSLNGVRFNADDPSVNVGVSLAVGDVNNDGLTDIIIGNYRYQSRELANIVFGQKNWSAPSISLKSLNGKNGFKITGHLSNGGSPVDIINYPKGNVALLIGSIPSDSFSSTMIPACAILTPEFDFYANTLTIHQNEKLTLSAKNFNASYRYCPDSSNLMLTVQNVEHGRFGWVNPQNQSALSFSQKKVWKGELQFVTDGSAYAPSFVTSFQIPEFFNITAYQTGNVKFSIQATPISPSIESSRAASILITIGSIAAALTLCLLSNAYNKYQTRKKLNALFDRQESSINNEKASDALLPIATAIFNQIKLTGFLNYISDESREHYFEAIKNLVIDLGNRQLIDFAGMSPEEKEKFISSVAEQTKLALVPKTGCSTYLRFFRVTPEVSPEAIRDKVSEIAEAVVRTRGERIPLLP